MFNQNYQAPWGDKLSFFEQKKGIEPTIITIDGFMTKGNSNLEYWKLAIVEKYPENSWYHIGWNSSNLKELFNTFSIYVLTNVVDLLMKKINFRIGESLKSEWNSALTISNFSGKHLAIVLEEKKNNQFILMGHSLGANFIKNCLLGLSENKISNIYEVHLLGGATDNKVDTWIKASKCVEKNIINYYSSNDFVLKTFYRISTKDKNPIGRSKINYEKIQNINVTNLVGGHLKFKREFKNYVK